ncbi:MAG TPA: DUF1634 domain-containing protein [Gemmatimonadaceae bacterium]
MSDHSEARLSDHAVEQLIGRLLQIGVAIAALVTLIGGVLVLIQHGSAPPDFSVFRGQPSHVTSVGGIVRGVLDGRSESIVQLGVVLLIATPIARVAFTLIAFLIQRDRLYVALTSLVLALLMFGLLFGMA